MIVGVWVVTEPYRSDQATAGHYPSLRRAVGEIDEGGRHTYGVNQHDVWSDATIEGEEIA